MVITKPVSSSPYKKKNQKVRMNIDLRTLTIFCKYVLSSSSYVRSSHLMNLKKLMACLDRSMFENDIEKIKRLRFIDLALEARIDNNLSNQEMFLAHTLSNYEYEADFINMNDIEMNKNEIEWVNKAVEGFLKYNFIYEITDEMLDVCTRIKNSDLSQRLSVIEEFESLMKKSQNYFREVKQETNATDIQFSLRDGPFQKSLRDTYNLITNPSRRLITGMQGFNEMLGGGFESGRVYMFFGLSGMGKSLLLLNIIYQMKRANKNYKTKDPTKTPCIVLLTMENTVVETLTRLFDLSVSNSIGMENYAFDDVLSKLRNEGELVLTNESPIDIVIRYKANRSVDTNYLYELYDDLDSDGYEIICLVQDHVKRIRSIWGSADLRLELGDVVNEFKVFAAEKDIPVITNSHLNRDAARVVEEDAAKANHTDVVMKLGKSNAGESLLMIDNLDGAFIINPDYDDDCNKYMVIKSIKTRTKEGRTYIVQPFVYGNSIRLVEDLNGAPMFVESLHQNRGISTRINGVKSSSTNVLNSLQAYNGGNSFNNNNVKSLTLKEDKYDDDETDINNNIITPIHFVNKPDHTDEKLTTESLKELAEKLRNAG